MQQNYLGMEYLREAKITIYKDTNKSSHEEILVIGEYNSFETIEEFLERVNKRIKNIYLDEDEDEV